MVITKEQVGAPTGTGSEITGDGLVPILLSVTQCAQLLGISHWTVRRLLASGRLSAVRIGTRVLVKASDIDKFIDQHSEIAADQPNPPALAAGGDLR